MKNWGIQARMTLLALGPATLIACLLAIYFTFSRIGDAEQALRDLGMATAQHLATSAEYGVVSGNKVILQNIVNGTLKKGQARFALVVDAQGNQLAQSGSTPQELEAGLRIQPPRANERDYVFVVPVQLGKVELQDPFALEDTNAQADRPLGWAVVAMSHASLVENKKRMLLAGLGIALGGLVITILIAFSLGRGFSRPVRKLSQVVEELGRGNLSARVAPNSGGELLLLQKGFNRMAETLQANQTDLQRRIQEATVDLEAKKDEAEQANRDKSNFLAAVSHDLRQPMHAIGLFSATLKQRVSTNEQAELVQRIEDSVNALQIMFDELLNISRLDSGTLEPRLEACDLAAILKQAGQTFQPLAEQKNLRLRVRACPARVTCDAMLLSRIINNLTANAIRYTGHGGVLIGCRRRQGCWVIQVWDTGIGIAEEHLPHIFEEYYQIGNAARNRAQGIGLGLAIVQRIARLLGYPLEVRSRPGRGTVFSITLPAASDASFERRTSVERVPGQFNGERVLVIDDDFAALESTVALLASWGLTPISAESGEQALDCLQNETAPSLIVCDYRLPHSSGIDVVRMLREHLEMQIPAMLISGDTGAEAVAAMQASGLPVLYKPVRPAKLRALITSLLR
ncbi:MAG: hypothetical protein A2Z01_06970 [Betaproteobacteria bacterium RBG_16_58_11]|nr:MAG: hypothetical protein A2Z01_06970 [Betaproteobacteria bacterium RBG_16_58_11]